MKLIKNINNIVVLFLIMVSLYFLFNITTAFQKLNISISANFYIMFITALLLFIIVHLIKSLRFYLILFESPIKFKEFIQLYVKTTFLNILLPFKLGELIRIYVYGKAINNYRTSLLSIITDRFFDTCILLIIIIPYGLNQRVISFSAVLLLFFVLILAFSFIIFPPTYRYLNEFIILNKSSKKAIAVLAFLDNCKEVYAYEKKLLKGRTAIILMLSAVAWLVEYLMLLCLGYGINKGFSLGIFVEYLNSALFVQQNDYLIIYTFLGSIVFAVTILSFSIYSVARRGLTHEKKPRNIMDV